MAKAKSKQNRKDQSSQDSLKKIERAFRKKEKELLKAKEKHQDLAFEYIVLWSKFKRAQRGIF